MEEKWISNNKNQATKYNKCVPGPKDCARNISCPMDAFIKIIDLEMTDEIVKYTNIYI